MSEQFFNANYITRLDRELQQLEIFIDMPNIAGNTEYNTQVLNPKQKEHQYIWKPELEIVDDTVRVV